MAAYLANVFQKRSNFVESLEEEWRGIVRTKSVLYTFCEKQYASTDDYLAAFCRISETIDNMRIVYGNAGETADLVGLYPYAPLHDMRRALQSIDPRKRSDIPAEEKKLARDAILQSFYALRENMLEELDLDEPAHPLLISGGRRLKQPGATRSARARQDKQRKRQDKCAGAPVGRRCAAFDALRAEQQARWVARMAQKAKIPASGPTNAVNAAFSDPSGRGSLAIALCCATSAPAFFAAHTLPAGLQTGSGRPQPQIAP